MAIASFMHYDVQFMRNLAQLETTTSNRLRESTNLALDALETIKRINKKITDDGNRKKADLNGY